MIIRNASFSDRDIELDGQEYTHCTFSGCNMIYRGGALPHMHSCTFRDCRWTLLDAAQNTICFLRGLYEAGGATQQVLDSIMESIRGDAHSQ